MPGTRNRAGLFLVYFFVCSLRSRSQKLVSATASQASLRSRQFKSGKCNFKSDKSFVRCAQVKFKDGNRNRNRNRNRNPRSSMDSRTSRTTPGRRWIHEHQEQPQVVDGFTNIKCNCLPRTCASTHLLSQRKCPPTSTDLYYPTYRTAQKAWPMCQHQKCFLQECSVFRFSPGSAGAFIYVPFFFFF